jgi:hypothetical protein
VRAKKLRRKERKEVNENVCSWDVRRGEAAVRMGRQDLKVDRWISTFKRDLKVTLVGRFWFGTEAGILVQTMYWSCRGLPSTRSVCLGGSP